MSEIANFDKSQGSVGTRSRCGGSLRYCFTADLSFSFVVKEFLKSANIWRSYKQNGLLASP